jgi:Novel STAND NTPase 3
MTEPDYKLHTLGWKSFQDLCVAVAEECLKRPVQKFLPSKDAGRDGAFVGKWENDTHCGSSTIQCKFTSLPHKRLALSLLADELAKVPHLAAQELAEDYIILTNHPISGVSEVKISKAFKSAGAGNCRIFGKDWIVHQIRKSGRLRMMVPRLYGLGDLGHILDARAYEQSRMILSTMGEDLKKLVVTDAHRKSVRAISEHNFVLLLGAPAAGKSTIGASLAVGAADIWGSFTIRAISPSDVKAHLNPRERQFFWIDDAWGSTQYQRHTIEAWNQILPLIQAAVHRGTQFLLTSRDYVWKAAKHDLKTQALPLLDRSQVIINVQALEPRERAQILYNHLKLGDQPRSFRTAVKGILPKIAESEGFLPETARRLGSTFFTGSLKPQERQVVDFFERPEEFLLETIRNLAADCRAAIALVFLSGGRIPSPVGESDEMQLAQDAFGVNAAAVRDALNALNGSLILLALDENGRYWTYKHPTIGDAFARLVAGDSELTKIYLRGAKPELVLNEVVCPGISVWGASVVVPPHLYDILVERLEGQESYRLAGFLSYRSDRELAQHLLAKRPDLLDRLQSFVSPISEDTDASFLAKLHEFGLLPEELRQKFVEDVRQAAVEEADASFLTDFAIREALSEEEIDSILREVEQDVLKCLPKHISRLRHSWDSDYPPQDYFDQLKDGVQTFATEISWRADYSAAIGQMSQAIQLAVAEMETEYEPPKRAATPPTSNAQSENPLAHIFRDVDD